jgi:hypothetical protein
LLARIFEMALRCGKGSHGRYQKRVENIVAGWRVGNVEIR